MFSTHLENFLPLSLNLELLSVNSFSLEKSKICHWEGFNFISQNYSLCVQLVQSVIYILVGKDDLSFTR